MENTVDDGKLLPATSSAGITASDGADNTTTPTPASSPPIIASSPLSSLHGSIVVVAKCPIIGKSKTRLIPLLGEEGSVALAKAMLADVLLTIYGCPMFKDVYKILLYAPGNEEGLQIMKKLLKEWKLSAVESENDQDGYSTSSWILLPMLQGDLRASDLGRKLEQALIQARNVMQNGSDNKKGGVVFLGIDAPQLSLEDVAMGLWNASSKKSPLSQQQQQQQQQPQPQPPAAMLCPADDGGYGMLCVPPQASTSLTFANMHWSHALTAVSQIKALTDQNIRVTIGKLMHDIDEPDDVRALCRRLMKQEGDASNENKNLGSVHSSSSTTLQAMVWRIHSEHPPCQYTRRALQDAGLLSER